MFAIGHGEWESTGTYMAKDIEIRKQTRFHLNKDECWELAGKFLKERMKAFEVKGRIYFLSNE